MLVLNIILKIIILLYLDIICSIYILIGHKVKPGKYLGTFEVQTPEITTSFACRKWYMESSRYSVNGQVCNKIEVRWKSD